MFYEDILILTEGGSKIGMGHISRCLSLYEELVKRGMTVRFLINSDSSIDLPNAVFTLLDFRELPMSVFQNKYIILDSYHTSRGFMEGIAGVARCLFIDDLGLDYPSGFVVNPSFYGLTYKDNSNAQFLVGKDYVILRKEFTYGAKTHINPNIDEITIIMGGTDVLSLSYKIYNALKNIPCRKNVIIGKGHDDFEKISHIADDNTRLLSNLSPQEIKATFLGSDLVITAGGQTCNELIALNIPFVVICVADNQEIGVRELVSASIALEIKACEVENVVYDVVLRLNENLHIREGFFNAMRQFDFSKGAENIVDEFLKD